MIIIGGKIEADTIDEAIIIAVARHGEHISPCFGRKTLRDSVAEGYLWYNDNANSTHVVKIRSTTPCSAQNTENKNTCSLSS